MDNSIHGINPYPLDSVVGFVNTYPLDSAIHPLNNWAQVLISKDCRPQLINVVCFSIQYPPPLIPPRGEVNAADAFDIGSFDEDDVKGIKVS